MTGASTTCYRRWLRFPLRAGQPTQTVVHVATITNQADDQGTRFVWIDLSPGGGVQASPLSRCHHRVSVPDHVTMDAAGFISGFRLALPARPMRPISPVSSGKERPCQWTAVVAARPQQSPNRRPNRDMRCAHRHSGWSLAAMANPAPCHRSRGNVFQHSELLKTATRPLLGRGGSRHPERKKPRQCVPWAPTGVLVDPREVPACSQVTSRVVIRRLRHAIPFSAVLDAVIGRDKGEFIGGPAQHECLQTA